MKEHTFESTGEAYDASQTDENIEDGDILIVPSEEIIGVLVEAWPVAIVYPKSNSEYTVGAFHIIDPTVVFSDEDTLFGLGRYGESIRRCQELAVADADILGIEWWKEVKVD